MKTLPFKLGQSLDSMIPKSAQLVEVVNEGGMKKERYAVDGFHEFTVNTVLGSRFLNAVQVGRRSQMAVHCREDSDGFVSQVCITEQNRLKPDGTQGWLRQLLMERYHALEVPLGFSTDVSTHMGKIHRKKTEVGDGAYDVVEFSRPLS